MKNKLILLGSILLYIILLFSNNSLCNIILYPIKLIVTFLHELGHAFFTILTLGHVHSLQINENGSGVTAMSGGNNFLISLGGYLGSFLFSNLLIYFGHKSNSSRITVFTLAGAMLLSAMFWHTTFFSTMFLLITSLILILLSKFMKYFITFIGFAALITVIQDYNVGPSSDYDSITFIPTAILTFGMLGIAIGSSVVNGYVIMREK